uniref:Uncharacterized protein n=1 Tax=Leersia perrieri TaxID=77586 RepID=A0A0D9WVT5_9ORYZ
MLLMLLLLLCYLVSRVELLDEVEIKAINMANEAYALEQTLLVQKIAAEHHGSDFHFVKELNAKEELWKTVLTKLRFLRIDTFALLIPVHVAFLPLLVHPRRGPAAGPALHPTTSDDPVATQWDGDDSGAVRSGAQQLQPAGGRQRPSLQHDLAKGRSTQLQLSFFYLLVASGGFDKPDEEESVAAAVDPSPVVLLLGTRSLVENKEESWCHCEIQTTGEVVKEAARGRQGQQR